MANKTLFQSARGLLAQATNTRNDAGAPAYRLSDKATLARLAATGCLTETFYADATTQLDRALEVASKVPTDFLAKTAIYARQKGHMKDMPALICAVLATRDLEKLKQVFPLVIDNGRMLRTFVQILRSGVTGRKSLGTAPKRLVREWLENASIGQLLNASIGSDPSLADIVKMVHPAPTSPEIEAFYGWLIGKAFDKKALPEVIREFRMWLGDHTRPQPAVPFQMLTARPLTTKEWSRIAERATWQQTRMNLNTFARHGVYEDEKLVEKLARRLSDPELVAKSRCLPYQLLVAYRHADNTVPAALRDALQDAMEAALENTPVIAGELVICVDVSGSMGMPVTGYRKGATSKVSCVDVAGLVAAALLRKNHRARVLPFDFNVRSEKLNPRDSVMTNASKLAAMAGGGTNCSAPLEMLNKEKARADLVIYLSDNESWMDAKRGRGTEMMRQWEAFKHRNKQAKLVCLDFVPNVTTQAPDRKDILNIGGFSDAVFQIIASFAKHGNSADHWVRSIENLPLNKMN